MLDGVPKLIVKIKVCPRKLAETITGFKGESRNSGRGDDLQLARSLSQPILGNITPAPLPGLVALIPVPVIEENAQRDDLITNASSVVDPVTLTDPALDQKRFDTSSNQFLSTAMDLDQQNIAHTERHPGPLEDIPDSTVGTLRRTNSILISSTVILQTDTEGINGNISVSIYH